MGIDIVEQVSEGSEAAPDIDQTDYIKDKNTLDNISIGDVVIVSLGYKSKPLTEESMHDDT